MILRILRKIKKTYEKLHIILLLKEQKGFIQKGKVKFKGIPIIKSTDVTIIIHNNVVINSNNHGYFINMHSPVKLCTSMPNAMIEIGENSRIHGSCIHAYEEIIIGKGCLIAANCQIVDTNRHELSFHDPSQRLTVSTKTKPVHIGDYVWIGANSIILPGVTIGEGVVVAAGSIVTKDIPPYSLYGGNPAKEISRFSPPNAIKTKRDN